MRTLLLAFLTILLSLNVSSQSSKIKNKKYPSLLWEITGKGLAKPSYLFGTMHVSSKMVFHLSDSFYLGIKNADVVALETNPATWQDDFSRYDLEMNPYSYSYRANNSYHPPSDYLSINTLKAFPYEKVLEAALHSNPSMINNFLYRSNSERNSDFEEDTYLDLYIYQVGRKWNKKLTGVEDFDESMILVKEAYSDAANDKTAKERNYDIDPQFSFAKLEDAYRTGNLDLIDTIQKLNSVSAAFDEKFLYKRNEIRAKNIDSILKTKASLFVGVGAAHLAGHRGVIEMLRAMGYKLRPIKMTERDSRHKEMIEQVRVPVQFTSVTADDGLYAVSIPGKLYSFAKPYGPLVQQQYADMGNGSYYIVSRIQTNAGFWGHNNSDVLRKVDSLLYENIPGKILSKQKILKNGYHGFDILNRTRRGDYQRYNIFITQNEVVLFKMSGNGDYVKLGKEADLFFSSIQLKEVKPEWKKYSPSFGGFEVDMPFQPTVSNFMGNWYFISFDKASTTGYQVIRTDVHNIKFVEEDSFDLNLMEESFASSEFIEKEISRKHSVINGYSALDVQYSYKNGHTGLARFTIQGPHYYTIIANAPKEHARMKSFLQSFSVKPFRYPSPVKQTDTVIHFTVSSPVPVELPAKLSMYPENMFRFGETGEDESHLEEYGKYKDKIITNDSTGEKIFVSIYRPGKYYFDNDTSATTDTLSFKTRDHDWVYRSRKKYELPNKTTVLEYELGDPLSSRVLRGKTFTRNGIDHRMVVQGDTLTAMSGFVKEFFTSFLPVDTLKGVDPLLKKTDIFFADFYSKDSVERKRAIKNIHAMTFDSADFPTVKKAITSLNWTEKKYLDVKNKFISKLAEIPTKPSADYLRDIYYAAGDTVDLQYNALEALLYHRNDYAYQVFRDIMLNEPPVLDMNSGNTRSRDYGNNNFFDQLSDSLLLTKKIFKDLLPLININDYEKPMMALLEMMVDSNMVSATDYEMYFSKFLIEAKQEMKKQVISEKNKSIIKAQKDAEEKDDYYGNNGDRDYGNSKLNSYAVLLMPFWDRQPAVRQLFTQMLNSNDKRLKLRTALLMVHQNRPVPDTMMQYFAGMDEFRYELYAQLKKINRPDLFPIMHNNHSALAKSELLDLSNYAKPDSFVLLATYPVEYKGQSGNVYFFKYRMKKEDNSWKIAIAGLVPKDPKEYEFDMKLIEEDLYFTELTETKLDEEEPLDTQLQKILKRKMYSKRKSAAKFYEEGDYDRTSPIRMRD